MRRSLGGGCGVGMGIGWGFGAATGTKYRFIKTVFDTHSTLGRPRWLSQLQDRFRALKFPHA